MNLWRRSSRASSTDSPVPTPRIGIRTVYRPLGEASVDICLVHGLRGHSEHSWTTTKGNAGFWPETLLPCVISDAQILTYGYDADVTGLDTPVSNNRIDGHARNLLSALATHRQDYRDNDRPIIFIAHSMGGLVCVDMLLSSWASPEPHLQKIHEATVGIAFLGTPHSGTAIAAWGERAARVVGLVKQANIKVTEVLKQGSEILGRIEMDFHSMLRTRREQGCRPIAITCFYEELPLPRIGMIVPQHSAVIPGYTAIGIHANHRDMARFTSTSDPGFVSLVGEIRQWIQDAGAAADYAEDFNGTANAPNLGTADSAEPTATENSSGTSNRTSTKGITILGDVRQSSVVSGHQIIYGGINFG